MARNTPGTILYADGFESGLTAWGNGGEIHSTSYPAPASSTISTLQSHSGTSSLKMTATHGAGQPGQTNNYRYTEPNDNNEVIMTGWFYHAEKIDQISTESNPFTCLIQWKAGIIGGWVEPLWNFSIETRGGKGTGGNNYIGVALLAERWDNIPLGHIDYTPLVNVDIPIGQWYKLDVRYFKGATTGRVEVWQDDVKIYDIQNIVTDPTLYHSEVNLICFAVCNYAESTTPATTNVYLDDFAVTIPASNEDDEETPPTGYFSVKRKFILQ